MRRIVIFLVLLILSVFSCTIGEPSKEASTAVKPGAPLSSTAGLKDSAAGTDVVNIAGNAWDRTVAEARKEGKVSVYGSTGLAVARDAISKTFMSRYGIEIDITTGRSSENAERMMSQRRAGLYTVDVLNSGPAPTIQRVFRPGGVLDPLEPALLLPEVKEPQNWIGGQLPWLDTGRYTIAPAAGTSGHLVVNTSLVKPEEELKSWLELLDHRWKGKMIINDLMLGGNGINWFKAMTDIMGLDYLKMLARQEPVMLRDQRLQVDWVARGRYSISIALPSAATYDYMKAGSPIKLWFPKEGGYLIAGSTCVSLVNRAPHPNAARVFINWLLTKEGQYIFSKYYGAPSLRVDVPTDHILPEEVPKPGVKYYNLLVEDNLPGDADIKLAGEIFGHLLAR